MNEILALARPEICAMTPYSSARREESQGKIWLNANESPWPLQEGFCFNRYPEPQPSALLSALANLYQVTHENLLITRGSDEAIDLLLRVFCAAGKEAILICPPTYGMYHIAAQIQHAACFSVPLDKENDFALDAEAVLKTMQPAIKLIFLCSPNNPTGNILNREAILWLCQQVLGKALVIVDEAYIEFSLTESLTAELKDHPNLVILRTLSKAYSLAGVRCGAVIANPITINLLQQIIAPYPIPTLIADLVVSQLKTTVLADVSVKIALIRAEREKLINFLKGLPYVKKVWCSQANFVLLQVADASALMAHCRHHGIIIRDRQREFNLQNCVRITVGSSSENQTLMEVLQHG